MPQIIIDDYKTEIIQTLFNGVMATYVGSTPGHVAEFGTMSGMTAEALALGIAKSEETFLQHSAASGLLGRELHLFDSFAGLPKITEATDADSFHVRDGVWGEGVCKGVSAETLRGMVERHLQPADRIRIFEGWYSDTVKTIPAPTRYAFVHIDCDLYASTRDVLDGLFSRGLVSKGAYLYFDDYNCNRGDPQLGERRAWAECIEKYAVSFSDCGGYGLCSHRFLVHDYRGAE